MTIASNHAEMMDHASRLDRASTDVQHNNEDIHKAAMAQIDDSSGQWAIDFHHAQSNFDKAGQASVDLGHQMANLVRQSADDFQQMDQGLGNSLSGHH